MIGSVTQVQQEALAAEKARRAQAGLIGRVLPEGDGGASAAASARGFEDGPGEPVMPGHPEPEDFRRGYIDAGHGAESPMAEPPRHNPMPDLPRGIVTPVALPDAPVAARIPQHIAGTYSLGSPSER